jgi:hypothetical protein
MDAYATQPLRYDDVFVVFGSPPRLLDVVDGGASAFAYATRFTTSAAWFYVLAALAAALVLAACVARFARLTARCPRNRGGCCRRHRGPRGTARVHAIDAAAATVDATTAALAAFRPRPPPTWLSRFLACFALSRAPRRIAVPVATRGDVLSLVLVLLLALGASATLAIHAARVASTSESRLSIDLGLTAATPTAAPTWAAAVAAQSAQSAASAGLATSAASAGLAQSTARPLLPWVGVVRGADLTVARAQDAIAAGRAAVELLRAGTAGAAPAVAALEDAIYAFSTSAPMGVADAFGRACPTAPYCVSVRAAIEELAGDILADPGMASAIEAAEATRVSFETERLAPLDAHLGEALEATQQVRSALRVVSGREHTIHLALLCAPAGALALVVIALIAVARERHASWWSAGALALAGALMVALAALHLAAMAVAADACISVHALERDVITGARTGAVADAYLSARQGVAVLRLINASTADDLAALLPPATTPAPFRVPVAAFGLVEAGSGSGPPGGTGGLTTALIGVEPVDSLLTRVAAAGFTNVTRANALASSAPSGAPEEIVTLFATLHTGVLSEAANITTLLAARTLSLNATAAFTHTEALHALVLTRLAALRTALAPLDRAIDTLTEDATFEATLTAARDTLAHLCTRAPRHEWLAAWPALLAALWLLTALLALIVTPAHLARSVLEGS